jgi:hypothetical protein
MKKVKSISAEATRKLVLHPATPIEENGMDITYVPAVPAQSRTYRPRKFAPVVHAVTALPEGQFARIPLSDIPGPTPQQKQSRICVALRRAGIRATTNVIDGHLYISHRPAKEVK